jgi:hypothetical protein
MSLASAPCRGYSCLNFNSVLTYRSKGEARIMRQASATHKSYLFELEAGVHLSKGEARMMRQASASA